MRQNILMMWNKFIGTSVAEINRNLNDQLITNVQQFEQMKG